MRYIWLFFFLCVFQSNAQYQKLFMGIKINGGNSSWNTFRFHRSFDSVTNQVTFDEMLSDKVAHAGFGLFFNTYLNHMLFNVEYSAWNYIAQSKTTANFVRRANLAYVQMAWGGYMGGVFGLFGGFTYDHYSRRNTTGNSWDQALNRYETPLYNSTGTYTINLPDNLLSADVHAIFKIGEKVMVKASYGFFWGELTTKDLNGVGDSYSSDGGGKRFEALTQISLTDYLGLFVKYTNVSWRYTLTQDAEVDNGFGGVTAQEFQIYPEDLREKMNCFVVGISYTKEF